MKNVIYNLQGISVRFATFLMIIIRRKKFSIVMAVEYVELVVEKSPIIVINANAALISSIRMPIHVYRSNKTALFACRICMILGWMLQFLNVVMVCILNVYNSTLRTTLPALFVRNH